MKVSAPSQPRTPLHWSTNRLGAADLQRAKIIVRSRQSHDCPLQSYFDSLLPPRHQTTSATKKDHYRCVRQTGVLLFWVLPYKLILLFECDCAMATLVVKIHALDFHLSSVTVISKRVFWCSIRCNGYQCTVSICARTQSYMVDIVCIRFCAACRSMQGWNQPRDAVLTMRSPREATAELIQLHNVKVPHSTDVQQQVYLQLTNMRLHNCTIISAGKEPWLSFLVHRHSCWTAKLMPRK